MKILVAFAVILLVSAQVLAAEIGLNEDIDWPYSDQIQEELQGPVFENLLQRIARKPRPDQFYGLMGKRNNGFSQSSHKRFGQISRKKSDTDSEGRKSPLSYRTSATTSNFGDTFRSPNANIPPEYDQTTLTQSLVLADVLEDRVNSIKGINQTPFMDLWAKDLYTLTRMHRHCLTTWDLGHQKGTHYRIMKEDVNETFPHAVH